VVSKSIKNRTLKPELCKYDIDVERDIIEVIFRNGKLTKNLTKVREIPTQDLWFEKVWKEYLEDNSGRY
jgi:hypothetical protein